MWGGEGGLGRELKREGYALLYSEVDKFDAYLCIFEMK